MQLDISYTSFIRTTDKRHQEVVETLLSKVWGTDNIYQDADSGKYCVGCEEYKDDGDLDEDGKCLVHKTPCPHRNEVRLLTDVLEQHSRSGFERSVSHFPKSAPGPPRGAKRRP